MILVNYKILNFIFCFHFIFSVDSFKKCFHTVYKYINYYIHTAVYKSEVCNTDFFKEII